LPHYQRRLHYEEPHLPTIYPVYLNLLWPIPILGRCSWCNLFNDVSKNVLEAGPKLNWRRIRCKNCPTLAVTHVMSIIGCHVNGMIYLVSCIVT
jgi:hypothetical protein